MARRLLALVCLALFTTALAAADKYAVPPHPASGTAKCNVKIDTGSPDTKLNKDKKWDVTIVGKYNYDDAWTFKELKAEIIYTKGMDTEILPAKTVTDETKLAKAGSFDFSFPGIRPPVEGEVVNVKVSIKVTKAGEEPKSNAEAKAVPEPLQQEEMPLLPPE